MLIGYSSDSESVSWFIRIVSCSKCSRFNGFLAAAADFINLFVFSLSAKFQVFSIRFP